MPWYATDFFNPPTNTQHHELLVAANAVCHVFPWNGDDPAFTLPPQGPARVYTIAINRNASRSTRPLALRHEIGHILAGEAEGLVYLSERDWHSFAERAADTFAFADLIPGRWLRGRRRGTLRANAFEEVRDTIAGFVEWWPEERIEDRAILRVKLFRECGI